MQKVRGDTCLPPPLQFSQHQIFDKWSVIQKLSSVDLKTEWNLESNNTINYFYFNFSFLKFLCLLNLKNVLLGEGEGTLTYSTYSRFLRKKEFYAEVCWFKSPQDKLSSQQKRHIPRSLACHVTNIGWFPLIAILVCECDQGRLKTFRNQCR